MKTTTFRSSCLTMLLAGALVAPAQLPSQGVDSVRTHVVRRGETLWSLAVTYLGNGHRWREFLALNPTIHAADSLPVGSTIRVPGTRRATPAPPAPSVRARPAAVVADSSPVPPAAPQAPDTVRRTIFFGARPAGGFAPRDTTRSAPADSAVPAGVFEAISAPFVVDAVALARGGRCLSVGAGRGGEAGGVLLQGTLSIQLPAGATARSGSRWLLVRRGPVLTSLGTVAVPTGVVRLTSDGGLTATAEVVAQYDAMSCSDVVLPAEPPPATPDGRRVPVGDGASGRVAWIASGSLLPTLQHALILDIGSAAGVRAGDRVTIYGRNGTTVVASADVVRVEPRSATVLVVRQMLGSLAAGLPVRVTEKLP